MEAFEFVHSLHLLTFFFLVVFDLVNPALVAGDVLLLVAELNVALAGLAFGCFGSAFFDVVVEFVEVNGLFTVAAWLGFELASLLVVCEFVCESF